MAKQFSKRLQTSQPEVVQNLFSSFHPINLWITKRILPEVPVALLALPGKAGALSRSRVLKWLSPQWIHPYFSDVNFNFILKQHHGGRKVNVWTVNDKEKMKLLIDSSIDGLITDDPSLVWDILEQQ